MKNKKYYILSFMLPILFLFIISNICGYVPFNKATFLIYDSYYEYLPILSNLSHILNGNLNIFYTLNGGMGVNFFSILCLYMGNPLNLFSYFFNNENIIIFYILLIYLKIGLSGISMYHYLNNIKETKKKRIALIFALIYALSGYITAFCMHIMWLDAYILLPLIIKELDNLIANNKGLKYCLLLAIAIIINYYTGYMLCIFMVIYFLYKSILFKKLNKKTILTFLKYSLFSGLLSSFILIPTLFNLLGGRLSNFSLSSYISFDLNTFISFLYNTTIASFTASDNYSQGTNTIYITIFCFLIIILSFFNKKISKREKKITLITLLFFIVSFSFPLIDYAWNLFQEPIWWSHRYQFVFVFLTLVISYKWYLKCDSINLKVKHKNIILLTLFFLLIISLSFKLKDIKVDDRYLIMFFISIIFIFVYLRIYKIKKKYVLYTFIILELSLNAYFTLKVNKGFDFDEITSTYKDSIYLSELTNDRIVVFGSEQDDGLFYDYHSLSLFSSSYNMRVATFMKKLGMAIESANHLKVTTFNPAVLSLLNVSLLIGDNAYFDCSDNVCINENSMPYIYGVNESILSLELSDNYVENINNIYSSLLNENVTLMYYVPADTLTFYNIDVEENNIIVDEDVDDEEDKASIYIDYTAETRCIIMFDALIAESYYYDFEVLVNKEVYDIQSDGYIVLNKNDRVEISYNLYDIEANIENYQISYLDLDVYEECIKKLKSETYYVALDSDLIKANIKTDYETLFISIPYDEGIKVYVDGSEVEYFSILDTFIGVNVDKGEHEIEIKYVPKGLKNGIIISGVSLIVLIFLEIIKRKGKAK